MKLRMTTRPGEANAAICAVCIIILLSGLLFPANHYVKIVYGLRGGLVEVFDGKYWLLITSILFHGGAMHLIFNMLMLWQLGNVTEEAVGSIRYVLLVIATAFVSSGIQLAFVGPGIGISGVVCGLIGFMWQARRDYDSFYLWMSDRNFKRLMIMLTVLIPIDYWVLNYGEGFGIAHVAHFVGVAAGAGIGRLASPTYAPQQKMPAAIGLALMLMAIIIVLVFPVKWSRPRMAYGEYKRLMSEYESEQLKKDARYKENTIPDEALPETELPLTTDDLNGAE